MALIPDEIISEVRARVDLVAAVGDHVQLRKEGRAFKGLCPFHQEKTGSFYVYGDKRYWRCYGCQRYGDVFKFLMELQGKSFGEVVKELASRVGVVIPERPMTPEERARQTERSRMLDLNAAAAAFYRDVLRGGGGARGRAYLASRGIGDEVAETFRLGLAPDGWDALVTRLEAKRAPLDLAVKLGLVAPRPRGGGHYDKFRDRLMCPVILPAGEIAGFSGRLLGTQADAPKYMNSPESSVYRKSYLLFGLHAAREGFRKKGRALLVEGNFDVIALHQAGFVETVAPLGTALTEHQVEILRRLTSSVTVCMDGDRAGRAAALRVVALLQAAGVESRVAELPDGEDPDSFVRKHGAAALEELLGRAKPGAEYFLDQVWFRSDRSPESLAAALREAGPMIAAIGDELKREIIIDRFARAMGVAPALVRRAAAQKGPAAAAVGAGPSRPPADPRLEAMPPGLELKVLAILADHPSLMEEAERLGVRSLLTDDRLRDMYSAARAGRSFVEAAPPDLGDAVAREILAGSYAMLEDPGSALVEAVRALQAERERAATEELRRQVKEAARRGDSARARELALLQVRTKSKVQP